MNKYFMVKKCKRNINEIIMAKLTMAKLKMVKLTMSK
jgi:hypothetical protein